MFSRPQVLTDYEEGVGGSDSVLPAREAQPVISQAETLVKTPSGVFRPFTSMRGGSNIDHPQRNDSETTGDQPTQAGQRPGQAEAHIRAYFLMIADIIGLTDTKSIMANYLTLDPVLETPPQTPHLNKNLKNHA
jgi:hypothetical protein